MRTEYLWMSEDQLRQELHLLWETLALERSISVALFNGLGRALEDGYRAGYSDAAVGLAPQVEERDAGCHLLH